MSKQYGESTGLAGIYSVWVNESVVRGKKSVFNQWFEKNKTYKVFLRGFEGAFPLKMVLPP